MGSWRPRRWCTNQVLVTRKVRDVERTGDRLWDPTAAR
jgi:hypothetical protein